MKLLAIDTTSKVSSVALLDGKNVAAFEILADATRTHAETILRLVEAVLQRTNTELKDVDAFAAAIGPGSFTGLRIALATAKGFALAQNKPLVGVSSLKSMALGYLWQNNPPSDTIVAPCIDARKDEVYGAAYLVMPDGSLKELVAENIFSPAHFENAVAELSKKTLYIGSGAARYEELLENKKGDRLCFTAAVASSIGVAFLGAEKISKNDLVPLAALVPNYMRKSDAEAKQGF